MLVKIVYHSSIDPAAINEIVSRALKLGLKVVSTEPNTILVEYPKEFDSFMYVIFDIRSSTKVIYPYELLNFEPDDRETIEESLTEINMKYQLLSDHSLVIFNDDEIHDVLYDFLHERVDYSIWLTPYDYHEYQIRIKHDFSHLFQVPTDVDLYVEGRLFKAHKLILMGASQKFFSEFTRWHHDQREFDIDTDPDLFQDLLNLIYGIDVQIKGLKSLELIKLADYLAVNLDKTEIIKHVRIDPRMESNEYIQLLSEIYPYILPIELIPYIKQNITIETNISLLNPAIRGLLKK